jgi:nicotinate-nucleotide--dimethylbenzimidazole phosphoribosyltransferase
MLLEKTISKITALDQGAMARARQRVDSLIKPPGSLGKLEDLAVRLAGITGNPKVILGDKAVIVMAGDHGVCAEGVSVAPSEITYQMLHAIVGGVAGIGVLSRLAGARLVVVDVGVACPVDIPGVISKKVRACTGNIALGPAMTREEAVTAVEVGIEVALDQIKSGVGVLALGDMGIGNTTPSSAILAVLSGISPEEATGRGTMVNDDILANKNRAVASALAVNRPDPTDGLDILSKVGGLEIAGLAGVVLAAAASRVPVIIDGFITTAAAMIAVAIKPGAKDFIIPSHLSGEQGHRLMLKYLDLEPMLHLDMRLGEGTGAVLAMQLMEAATRIANEMASFDEAGVSDLDEDKIAK